jgi:hypothetical protein
VTLTEQQLLASEKSSFLYSTALRELEESSALVDRRGSVSPRLISSHTLGVCVRVSAKLLEDPPVKKKK